MGLIHLLSIEGIPSLLPIKINKPSLSILWNNHSQRRLHELLFLDTFRMPNLPLILRRRFLNQLKINAIVPAWRSFAFILLGTVVLISLYRRKAWGTVPPVLFIFRLILYLRLDSDGRFIKQSDFLKKLFFIVLMGKFIRNSPYRRQLAWKETPIWQRTSSMSQRVFHPSSVRWYAFPQ
jgi:hypothetical protein